MKVGKAIYNILSQSSEVQSNFPFNTTDYSPTGTELVTNGDFSATGGELITNGDFSATGSELVDNNDFLLGTDDWSADNDSTISVGTHEGRSNVADIEITGTGTGDRISQSFAFTEGKSYKVVVDVYLASGSDSFRFDTADSFVLGNFVETDSASGWTTLTGYIVALDTGAQDVWLRSMLDGASGQLSHFYIDSVSIKELGEDWTDDGTPIKAATFDANGLTITTVNGDGNDNRVSQSDVAHDGKSYKVTYTIHSATLTGSNVFQYYNGTAYITIPTAITGTPQTFYFTSSSSSGYWNSRVVTYDGTTTDYVTISSISVEELGEGWTVPTGANEGWTFGDGVAICDGVDSNALMWEDNLPEGEDKVFKVTFTISSYTSGSVYPLFKVDGNYIARSELGTYVIYGVRAYENNFIYLRGNNFIGTISSISVEEMVLNKIFPELAPPDIDAPYVVYSVVSNSPSETKNTNGDIDTANIEVYGFQDTYNKAVDLGVSVRAALDRKTGTYNTIEIQSTNYVNEQMDVNEARKLWAAIQDYTIRIKNI